MTQILVVEDDPRISSFLAKGLAAEGYTVTVAADESAARAAIGTISGDLSLVLLDLGLPGLGGYEALRMMRAISKVPVVVITARDDETEIIRVLDAGADDYIVKPFGGGQVDARIRAVLRSTARIRASTWPPPKGFTM